ncbi:hypothetical protein F5J12DRAFT_935998 [Pisolithus orientalis]|uniref:uncharacterized protein n=1 Tax=Pisolithus orientalis TaxID=936130 RepID=UPI0022250353|nr:uncharacterized protein F5J12DRAFT_935998 [Pisolithus orientalis]KAI6008891.1 hypothetical protein F5J12DRAFT_935998 [Pisolithus orientalis]
MPGSRSSGSGMTSASASPGLSCHVSPNVDTLNVSKLNGDTGLGGLGGSVGISRPLFELVVLGNLSSAGQLWTALASKSDLLMGDRSPMLTPDPMMQPAAYEFGEDGVINVGVHGVGVHSVGVVGTSRSELMGALGGDNIISGMGLGGGAGNGITLGGIHIGGVLGHAYAGTFEHHAYPGLYHLDYLSSQFHLDASLPFLGVNGVDREESPGAAATGSGAGAGKEGEGNGEADVDEHRSSKHCHMSTDSLSKPPSLVVSYLSYAESMMLVSTAPTSVISGHSKPGFETTWPCAFAVNVHTE